MFPDDMGRVLLPLARAAIAERLHLRGPHVHREDWLAEQGATFVTLHLSGQLRGCIGTIEPHRSVGEDTEANALAAAFRDPRFPALTVEEYERIDLEVSVLSPMEPVAYEDEADLLAQLRPGVDGLLLDAGWRRGTFLPQVWEQLPQPEHFLARLKAKAGFPARHWDPDWQFFRYTVRQWSETGSG